MKNSQQIDRIIQTSSLDSIRKMQKSWMQTTQWRKIFRLYTMMLEPALTKGH